MVKKVLILICFLIVLSGIGIVNAETLTGTLGSSSVSQKNFTLTHNSIDAAPTFTHLSVNDIQNTIGLTTIVRFDNGFKPTFTGTKAGNTTNCTVSYLSQTIATGTFGYQRVWNSGGTEIDGSQYYYFGDTWNVTGLTGDLMLTVTMDQIDGIAGSPNSLSNTLASSGGATICWASNKDGTGAGYYLNNFQSNTFADYTVSKPSGIGTEGRLNKTSGGVLYSSRAFIFDGITDAILASDSTVTTTDLIFNVINQQIKIGIQDSSLNWFNTTVLFSPGTGTPTPTITPTPAPTIPAGYIRTFVHVWDRSGNHINGANIDIRDVEAAVWKNSTHDTDGISYIDTLPYHTINIYGSFDVFANEFLPNSLLGQETGFEGGYIYYLTLFPVETSAGAGQVSLNVEVKDADNHYYVNYAVVQAAVDGGYTYSQNTASAGSAVFLVPNNTIVRLSATAAGYMSGSAVINSGTGTFYSTTIELRKATVTASPTTTIPPGGVTPVRTVDPRTDTQKGQAAMSLIYDNAESIVMVCILVTILGLLGIKLGK